MRNIVITSWCTLSTLLLFYGCHPVQKGQQVPQATSKGLKNDYKNFFPIGVAVNIRSLKSADTNLILREFNSITPENDMKIGPIHPAENEYNWKAADSIVAFARRHGLRVRGHNLVWHYASQTPQWIFKDENGNPASKELVLQRLKDHINTVVSRYKGAVYAWDVANEVISDKPGEYLRQSEWYKICGEDYIFKAFQYAHEADPQALLFYNDYNEINPEKREKIYRLVKSLKEAGVPIHGLGLQAHWSLHEPTEPQLDSTLHRFSDLGVTVQITEMDISMYPKEHTARERKPSDEDTLYTPQREQAQTEQYAMCFRLFRHYKNLISGVTFWNLSDRYSWLDNFPVRNRKDYPLLFDKNGQPKKAYWQVANMRD